MLYTTTASEHIEMQIPKAYSSRRTVTAIPSSDTFPTMGLDTDEESYAAMDVFTDLDEDSTIVSSARSFVLGDRSSAIDVDSSESTIDGCYNNSAAFFNDSTVTSESSSPDLTYIDSDKTLLEQAHKDINMKAMSNEQTNGATLEESKSQPTPDALRTLNPNPVPVQNGPKRFQKLRRRMSLGEMESIMDTAFRSWKSLGQTGKSQRRLSFATAVEQKYDNTAPACELAQECLTRRDSWARRSKQSAHFTTVTNGVLETPKKSHRRLKSVLKLFPRFSRNARGRSSITTPKLPERSQSFKSEASELPCDIRKNDKEVRWGTPQNASAPPSMPRLCRR